MIVLQDVPEVIGFVENSLGIKISPPCQAFGYLSDDKMPVAGVVINDYIGSNCELTIVAERGRVTRGVIRHIANHVFTKLGCRRATIRTRKSNRKLLKIIPRLGFTFENVAKHYYHDSDAVVFRMLKADCPWIKQ